MALIDIGRPAFEGTEARGNGSTLIELGNSANADGTIDTIEIWAYTALADCKAGTFYGAGTLYTNRDYASLGTVAAGSKQTFSGLSVDVTTGDFIGIYFASGDYIWVIDTGGDDVARDYGDQFGTGQQTYTIWSGYGLSLYGTGTTPVVGRSHGYIIG